jgi:hypothetical protein
MKTQVPGIRVIDIKEKCNSLKTVYNTSKIKDLDIADDLCKWSTPKNSKSRSCSVSTEDVPQVKRRNRFSVLENYQQNTGFLKNLENKVKPQAGMTKFRRGGFDYLKVVMGGQLDPCS